MQSTPFLGYLGRTYKHFGCMRSAIHANEKPSRNRSGTSMTNAEHRIPRGDSLCPKNQAKTDVQDQESNLEIYAYGCNSLTNLS